MFRRFRQKFQTESFSIMTIVWERKWAGDREKNNTLEMKISNEIGTKTDHIEILNAAAKRAKERERGREKIPWRIRAFNLLDERWRATEVTFNPKNLIFTKPLNDIPLFNKTSSSIRSIMIVMHWTKIMVTMIEWDMQKTSHIFMGNAEWFVFFCCESNQPTCSTISTRLRIYFHHND